MQKNRKQKTFLKSNLRYHEPKDNFIINRISFQVRLFLLMFPVSYGPRAITKAKSSLASTKMGERLEIPCGVNLDVRLV